MDITHDSPPPRPPDAIDAVVAEMQALLRHRTLEAAIDLGTLVVKRLFDGDFDRVGDTHAPSLRALAAHPDLPVSRAQLYQAVRIARLVEEVPEARWLGLGIAHLRAVLPLEGDDRRRLLLQASGAGWTSRELTEAVRAIKPPSKGGRPRLPRVVKTVRQMESLATVDTRWADADALAAMGERDRSLLAASLDAVERRLRGVRLALTPDAEGEP